MGLTFLNYEEIKRYVENQGIHFIDIRYADFAGRWRHISIPAKPFPEWVFRSGVAFDSSSTSGFESVEKGDLCVRPEIQYAFLDNFHEQKTLCFISRIVLGSEGYKKDPVSVLLRAEDYMRESGIATDFVVLSELEFYIFDRVRFVVEPLNCGFELSSSNELYPVKGGYELCPPQDAYFELRNRVTEILSEMDIPVKYHHHEGGVYGQNELELAFMPASKSAHAIMVAKYVIKMVSAKMGKFATFMPKPFFNQPGSGLHFHQFLARGKTNLFYDATNKLHLSKTALNFMGGILVHLPALMAFTNPSTNSYKRLSPGFEAPTKACFGVANRTATIRIPSYDDTPEFKRFELRVPDSTANIYFALASILMAGLDGIAKEIDPIQLGYGPLEENVEDATGLPSLPVNLHEAIRALESDNDFLKVGDVFSDELIESWIRIKKMELQRVESFPHPKEFELYFDL